MSAFVELSAFYKILDKTLEPAQSAVGHFNIFKVEELLMPAGKPVSYSRRDFYKISLVAGQSRIHYADQCFEVQESALVFTNPMVPYFWERISEKHTGWVCIFTEDFFNRFAGIRDYPVFQSTDMAVVPLAGADFAHYQNLFQRMFDELQGSYVYKYDLLRNLIMELVHGAQKMQPAHGNPLAGSTASERITALFAELLERQFPIELSNQVIRLHTASAFARQLNVHVNHLNKVLKETTGRTTTQLINERVLQEARILLKSTSWTVNEIAWSLGFGEPNHFSSFFRSRTRLTPNAFRKAEQ